MTSGTLHFPRISDTVGLSNGVLNNYETWKNLEIYDWLNNRVYNALPIGLRSILYQCDISSLEKGHNQVDMVEAYCWLPSITNLVSNSLVTNYTGEDVIFTIMTNKQSTYRWTNA
jgi:hypothetical protein